MCAFFVGELALRGVAFGTISAFWEVFSAPKLTDLYRESSVSTYG